MWYLIVSIPDLCTITYFYCYSHCGSLYNPFLVYCHELAPGTVSLTGDRAQGDDSEHDSHYNCSMFCCTLLYVHSSIAIILMRKRGLIALLNLSSWCLVMVERLFLGVPQGCLQFVIVVFPDHTHLLFLYLLFVRTHNRAFQIITCRTDKRKMSFFPRTVKDWNALAPHIMDSETLGAFKASVSSMEY